MNQERKRPVAVCSDCITYAYDKEVIGRACGRKRGSTKCAGVYDDAEDPLNWKECTACSGTGIDYTGERCIACQQSGWLLTRRREK